MSTEIKELEGKPAEQTPPMRLIGPLFELLVAHEFDGDGFKSVMDALGIKEADWPAVDEVVKKIAVANERFLAGGADLTTATKGTLLVGVWLGKSGLV